jgi:hypothetical protein
MKPKQPNNRNVHMVTGNPNVTARKRPSSWAGALASLWSCALVLFALGTTMAQSIAPPTINTTTWTPAGNPYILTDNSTVPAGQTLTIQPGVIVWIGENLSLTVNGSIQAIGTPTQRITFQSPVPSQYWSNIVVNLGPVTNRFKYCDFNSAYRALSLRVSSINATRFAEIWNCTFSNCLDVCISAQSIAGFTSFPYTSLEPDLRLSIKNCKFESSAAGCRIRVSGSRVFGGVTTYFYSYGKSHSEIMNCVFSAISGIGVQAAIGNYPGPSTLSVVNNTFVNVHQSLATGDPWDVSVVNNIVSDSTIAVERTGSLSQEVSYNCFFNNATNFIGYPSTYGQAILQNRNGTPCDLLFNIFQDPLFVGANDFHLGDGSPCIDAGDTTNPNYGDLCFDVSRGTEISDLGAYGGPDACNWLDVVPLLSTSPWMTRSNSVPAMVWDAIPRSTYRIQYITNATDTQWKNLMDLIAVEKRTARTLSATNSESYFRIQSLGRTPGH